MRGSSGQRSRVSATRSPLRRYRNRSRCCGDAYMVSCHLLQTCTRDCHSPIRRAGWSSGQDTQNANISRRTSLGRVSIVSMGLPQDSPVQPRNSVLHICARKNQKRTMSASHPSFQKSLVVVLVGGWVWAGTSRPRAKHLRPLFSRLLPKTGLLTYVMSDRRARRCGPLGRVLFPLVLRSFAPT